MESRRLLASAHPIVVATLGDSLSDEYEFYGPQAVAGTTGLVFPLPADLYTVGRSSARNWVENLAATRSSQVTFGAYSATTRGEVRNQGFAEDWARSGAVASGLDPDGSGTTFAQEYAGSPAQSLPGLLTQTTANSGYAPKNINVVTILIGANDYVDGLTEYAQSLGQTDVFTAKTARGTNAVNAEVESSIKTAVTQIRHTIPKAKIIVISPPDVTAAPLVESALATGASVFPDLSSTVSGSLTKLNSDLASYSRQQRVGFINTQSLVNQFRSKPTIEGVTVNLQSSGQNLTDGFVGDGFHPGTIIQGGLAQVIVAKIDAMYGSKVITPITKSDILSYAIASQPTVTLSLVAPSGTATSEQSTFEAVVSPGSGNNSTPTGTVTFETLNPATSTTPATPGEVLGAAQIDGSGMASLPELGLPSGEPVIAVYSGDQFNEARNSNAVATGAAGSSGATNSGPISTSTQISLSQAGFNVNVNINVVPANTSQGLPSGTVTLNFSRNNPIMAPIVNGFVSVALPINQYRNQTVQVIYSGSSTFNPSQSATVPI